MKENTRALVGVTGGILLANVGSYIWFPVLVATLGGTDSGFWAGVVMCMTYVGRLLATFFYEGIAARTGVRGGVFLGTALEAVALGLMGFTDGVLAYSLLAFFIGFGSGVSFPGLKNVLVSFPEAERPKAFSAFQMAGQVGLFGGALLGGVLADVELRTLFSVVFAFFIGFCLITSALIPRGGFESAAAGGERVPLFSLSAFKGIEVRGATRYFLLSAAFWFLSLGFVVGIPLHMAEYVPQWAPSSPFWITGLSILVLQYPLFKLFDKRFGPGAVMAFGLAGMTVAFLAFGAGRTGPWVVVGCLTVVLGEILFVPSFDLWIARRVPEHRLAKAMGAMHFFRSAGNMVGSLAAGILFDLSRSVGIAGGNWYVAALLAAGCALICLSGRDSADSEDSVDTADTGAADASDGTEATAGTAKEEKVTENV
ncbi:MFS transporter [Streptomyces huasconensis]|uniref:MFS transporter n=1 Tax=Streptomyces huasconensis TaxID=1854574 RepID=A0ABV3LTK6_9ACTN